MNEKTKKLLLSLAVRSAVATVMFAAVFALGSFVPRSTQYIEEILTKSMDVKKIGALFAEIAKEAVP